MSKLFLFILGVINSGIDDKNKSKIMYQKLANRLKNKVQIKKDFKKEIETKLNV
jgi:hypothetical protein